MEISKGKKKNTKKTPPNRLPPPKRPLCHASVFATMLTPCTYTSMGIAMQGHFTRYCALESRLTIPSPSHLLKAQHGISQHISKLKGGDIGGPGVCVGVGAGVHASGVSTLVVVSLIESGLWHFDSRHSLESSRASSRASRLSAVVDLLNLIISVFNVHVPGGWRLSTKRTWRFNNRRSKEKKQQQP